MLKFLTPEEIAECIQFVCSKRLSHKIYKNKEIYGKPEKRLEFILSIEKSIPNNIPCYDASMDMQCFLVENLNTVYSVLDILEVKKEYTEIEMQSSLKKLNIRDNPFCLRIDYTVC